MKVVMLALPLILLAACGITEYQKAEDAKLEAFQDLHSPQMERRIAEAK